MDLRHLLVPSLLVGLLACATEPVPAPGVDTRVDPDAEAPGDAQPNAQDAQSEDDVAAEATRAVTWHRDVRPLVVRSCNGCHAEGAIGGFPVDDVAALGPLAPLMVGRVLSGEMPPWPMDPGCRDVQDARFLTEPERAVFAAWRDAGYAVGDPADFAPLPPRDSPQAPARAPDLALMRAEPYVPSQTRVDDYRCFVFEQSVEVETWVTGVEVRPDALALVHHALVYVVEPGAVDGVLARDAAAEGPGYPCLGGVGAGEREALLAGWVPGMLPMHFPEGAAFRVAPGARFVIQMHYNTLNVPDGSDVAPDATGVSLWTLPRGASPSAQVAITPIADGDLAIPPGVSEVVEGVRVTSPASATIIGVIPHMHLLGRSIGVTVTRSLTGEVACLADIPRWDFHWQQVYQFKPSDHVPLLFGDTLALRCVYDNSAENQPVVDGVRQQPRGVAWGEGTLDEMCLAYLVTTSPWGAAATGTCPGAAPCIAACPAADVTCAVQCLAHAGQRCADCALEPLFTTCGARRCPAELATLATCIRRSENPSDVLGAAFGPCRPELEAHYACLEPHLRAGACDEDLAACDLSFTP
jgi:hypothetical protein